MNEEIIKLTGLTKRYGYGDTESIALKDFDLTIKRGEFIMIMGPSGCGKTTLLNIIGLLDRATDGEYILNGEDVAGATGPVLAVSVKTPFSADAGTTSVVPINSRARSSESKVLVFFILVPPV